MVLSVALLAVFGKCFWAWKGDYINFGAGAELAIYYGGDPHWRVDRKLSMLMSVNLDYGGENIIQYTTIHWWVTGFNPAYQNVNAGDLTATYTVYFGSRGSKGAGMYDAFRESKPVGWTFNDANRSATYIF